jgi:hypothetical protein
MDASAQILGARPSEILRRIHLPMLRGPALTAAIVAFVEVLKELPATLLIRPFNFDTLAVGVYRFASDERLAEAAVGALVIVAASLVPVILLSRAIASAALLPARAVHDLQRLGVVLGVDAGVELVLLEGAERLQLGRQLDAGQHRILRVALGEVALGLRRHEVLEELHRPLLVRRMAATPPPLMLTCVPRSPWFGNTTPTLARPRGPPASSSAAGWRSNRCWRGRDRPRPRRPP